MWLGVYHLSFVEFLIEFAHYYQQIFLIVLFLQLESTSIRGLSSDLIRSVIFSVLFLVIVVDMENKFQVLGKFRPFLHLILNRPPEKMKMTNNKHVDMIKSACKKVAFILLLLSAIIFFVSVAWFCIDEKFQLEMIALPISLFLGYVSMNLIYISVVLNGERLEAIIDFLQEIVEKRKNTVDQGKRP